MALLIDGYNLLHVTDIFAGDGPGTELHRARVALLDALSAALTERERRGTTIVFDAAGAPPGLPGTIVHAAMTVRFAQRHADADEMIEELLEEWAAPKALVVVSGDRRVQRAARHRGATWVDSGQWYAELQSRRAAGGEAEAPAKPTGEVPQEEVKYWVREFEDSSAAEESTDAFPPGYGEDVREEE